MTREAVSAAKPAVRAQAKTEKVHGAASAAALKGLVYGAAVLTFAVLLFLDRLYFGDGHSASQAVAVPVELYL